MDEYKVSFFKNLKNSESDETDTQNNNAEIKPIIIAPNRKANIDFESLLSVCKRPREEKTIMFVTAEKPDCPTPEDRHKIKNALKKRDLTD